MKQKLQKKLFADFPEIFYFAKKNKKKDPQLPMAGGIQTEDGWFDLIYNLCKRAQEYCDKTGIQIIAVQVKEKLGRLCFYYETKDSRYNDAIDKMIRKAEKESVKICEMCGSKEKVTRNLTPALREVRSLCPKCHERKEYANPERKSRFFAFGSE